MRKRVLELTHKAVRDGDLRLRDIPKLAQEMIERSAAGLNNAVPQSSRNVLRQVVDGLTDAATATIRSTRSTASAMADRGTRFVKHDAARVARNLREVEGDFVAALERAGRSLKGAAKDEMNAIVRRARRAGTRIRPAAKRITNATDGRLLELGAETAKASARVTRSAIATVLQGAAGLFEGLGDAVGPSAKSGQKSRRGSK